MSSAFKMSYNEIWMAAMPTNECKMLSNVVLSVDVMIEIKFKPYGFRYFVKFVFEMAWLENEQSSYS